MEVEIVGVECCPMEFSVDDGAYVDDASSHVDE